jgi:ankyrin repeat protein
MSSNSSNNSSDDEGSDELSNIDEDSEEEVEREFEDQLSSEPVLDLIGAITRNDAAGVRKALRNGANVNYTSEEDLSWTPLMRACRRGYTVIVRILLDAGADPWRTSRIHSAMWAAIAGGHLSIVEMLLNHDKDLLEIVNLNGKTPLQIAIDYWKFEVVNLLLDRGANALATTKNGETTLSLACCQRADLRLVRRLLAAGVAVDARGEYQRTALHHAAMSCNIAVVRELIIEHNANIFAIDDNDKTPFDSARRDSSAGVNQDFLIECYSDKLTQEHGRLALHAVLAGAEYSFAEAYPFHPPLNPLQIRLPLGKLRFSHFRTLLHSLDVESIRNRDKTRKLPIHMACQANAPVEVLSLLTEMDPTTLQIADYSGALPIHSLCGSGTPADYASVRFLVEQGGVGTLAARNREGALPLHVLCGSTNPSLRTVQCLIQSFPTSVAAQTTAGQYSFMIAACKSSTASLSVVYELVRTSPGVVIPSK